MFQVRGDVCTEGHRGIQASFAQVGEQGSGRAVVGVQVHGGMPLGQGGEQGLEAIASTGGQAEPQFAGDSASGRARGREGIVGRMEGSPRWFEQCVAGIGELDATSRPLEQVDTELGLQLPDRGAQRLLGHVQAGRSSREVPLLGDGNEVAQQPQVAIHTGPLAASLRRRPLAICGFSVVQFSIPMLLIAQAERSVPSSLVGCLIATEPMWIVLLARRTSGADRPGPLGIVGLLAGLVGVAVLLGVDFGGGLVGAVLALGAAAAYALASLAIPRLTVDVPVMHLVAVGLAISAFTLLPLVLAAPPDHLPKPLPVVALIGLAVACTAVAFPLWFTLIVRIGPARAALVTYTSPIVAVLLGIALLDEQLGRFTPVGLTLILAGSWLASHAAPARRILMSTTDSDSRARLITAQPTPTIQPATTKRNAP